MREVGVTEVVSEGVMVMEGVREGRSVVVASGLEL